jgi:hypothetical protein
VSSLASPQLGRVLGALVAHAVARAPVPTPAVGAAVARFAADSGQPELAAWALFLLSHWSPGPALAKTELVARGALHGLDAFAARFQVPESQLRELRAELSAQASA